MGKTIGYYPGCALDGTSKEYNESMLSLAELFGIELVQIPDWNCCGATAAHNLNNILAIALPARVLAQAEESGMSTVVVPCAACYSRLAVTAHQLKEDGELRTQIEEIIGAEVKGRLEIINVLQFVQRYIAPNLSERVINKLNNKVACYYGCLLVRPHDILKFDRLEDPQSMDEVMSALGAEPIEWPFKTECCGASLSVTQTHLAARLSGDIIKEAEDRGAEAIVVACPMCQSNLDLRRGSIDKYLGAKSTIPVIYITQAIGYACGLDERAIGSQRHIVKVDWQQLTQMKKES